MFLLLYAKMSLVKWLQATFLYKNFLYCNVQVTHGEGWGGAYHSEVSDWASLGWGGPSAFLASFWTRLMLQPMEEALSSKEMNTTMWVSGTRAPGKRKWGGRAPSSFMTHTDTGIGIRIWGSGVLGIFTLERAFCLRCKTFCIFMLVVKENRAQSCYTQYYKACLTGIHSNSIKFSIMSRKFPLNKSTFHLSARNVGFRCLQCKINRPNEFEWPHEKIVFVHVCMTD